VSNALAVAAVSATLSNELTDAFVRAGSLNANIGNAQAFVGRPGRTHTAPAGVDIFLYRVGPNPALANCDVPTRNGAGGLVEVPTAALSLWYLMAFFGDPDQLLPEQLLGVVTARLHAEPLLTPAQITTAVTAVGLTAANLQDQPEYVRLRRISLTDDELNHIWMMMPTEHFALSVVYEASVVLVEAEAIPSEALPVTERGIVVMASGFPVVTSISSSARPPAPIIAGTELSVRGTNLVGPNLRVEIDDFAVPANNVVVRSPGELRVTMSGTIRPGAHSLAVGQTRPPAVGANMQDLRSDDVPFVVRPVVLLPVTKPAGFVQAQLSTAVLASQELRLIFNEVNTGASMALTATATPSGQDLRVPIGQVPNGTYIVRARVDGASSVPSDEPSGPFNMPPTVVVP
jgi:hypothetical protein